MIPVKNSRKITEYIIPSLLTGALFLIVLAVNGLWPFGRDTIDYYDMAQQAVPFYYHNYDELHGLKSFVFDWYTNLGRVIPGLSEPSLFDILLYLLPRDMILQCMSLLMMIKIMVAAFTMNLFIKHVNVLLPYSFRAMLAAGYGLCGFVLANYTIPQWLDMAALVPLVLMFAQIALMRGKITGLTVTVFLIMLEDYYFAIQMLTFVFLIGGAYCIFCFFTGRRSGKKKDLHCFRFAAGIIAGLGLSAFSWISDISFNLTSARFENNTSDTGLAGKYLEVICGTDTGYISRWFCLLCLAFPAALALTGIIRRIRQKEYSKVIFWILCIFMATAQLLFESIHLILHFLSYVNYPVRNGFMVYCIVAGIAAYAYKRADESAPSNAPVYMVFIAAGMAAGAPIAALARKAYVHGPKLRDHDILIITMLFMAVCALCHVFLLEFKKARYRCFCLCIWTAEVLMFGMMMIGKPLYSTEYGSDPEQEGEFIRITDQLVSGFGDRLATGPDAATCRVKNPDTGLNANYGMIMRRETLSGWTSFATPTQIDGAVSLGYSSQFTRMLDAGGNIFSDTILHVTDVISCGELDDRLYEKTATTSVVTDHMTGEKRDYHLYKNRFEMPFAIPVKDASLLKEKYDNTVDLVNSFAAAFGSDKDIARAVDYEPKITSADGHEITTYRIRAEGKETLYFAGDCVDTEYYNTSISVNGKLIKIPSIKEDGNYLFPAHFNNNTVELGTFENEDVEVIMDMDVEDAEQRYDHYLYRIDIDALSDLCEKVSIGESVTQGARSLDINIDKEPGISGVLVPVPYEQGWTARTDAGAADIVSINGLFMYVPTGGGSVHMSYLPPMMKSGAVIAVITLICFAVLLVMDKKKEPAAGVIDRAAGYAWMVAFAAVFSVIYIVPIVFAFTV